MARLFIFKMLSLLNKYVLNIWCLALTLSLVYLSFPWFFYENNSDTLGFYEKTNSIFLGLGAIFAAYCAWESSSRNIRQEFNYRRHDINKEAAAVASSFAAEISSIIIDKSNKFSWISLLELKFDEQATLVIEQNYFCVYEQNIDRLGLLKPEIAKGVVTWYTQAKGFLDSCAAAQKGYPIKGRELKEALDDLILSGKRVEKKLNAFSKERYGWAEHYRQEAKKYAK